MVDRDMSLGEAIGDLRPDADAREESRKAEAAARERLARAGRSDPRSCAREAAERNALLIELDLMQSIRRYNEIDRKAMMDVVIL